MIHAAASQRIEMLRLLMIFGVVIVHTQICTPVKDMAPGWYPDLLAFFQDAVFRCSVPLLSLISGYCLFKSGMDLQFKRLLTRKARTLLAPFLIFNLGMLAVDVLVYRWTGRSIALDPATMGSIDWLNAAFALSGNPVNFPLYFLRDLIVLVILAPVFGLVLRHAPFMGVVGVAALFLTNMEGGLILRDDMAVEFYLGGLLAIRRADILALDKYAVPAAVLFMAGCIGVTWFNLPVMTPLRLLGPFLIWPAASALATTSFGQWMARQSRYSFFIFIAHAPVLLVLWTVDQHAGQPIPGVAFPVIAPLLTVALLIALYKVAAARVPQLFNLAIGARTTARVRHDRRLVASMPGMWPQERERRMASRRTGATATRSA